MVMVDVLIETSEPTLTTATVELPTTLKTPAVTPEEDKFVEKVELEI